MILVTLLVVRANGQAAAGRCRACPALFAAWLPHCRHSHSHNHSHSHCHRFAGAGSQAGSLRETPDTPTHSPYRQTNFTGLQARDRRQAAIRGDPRHCHLLACTLSHTAATLQPPKEPLASTLQPPQIMSCTAECRGFAKPVSDHHDEQHAVGL